jgi:hypothetical protein
LKEVQRYSDIEVARLKEAEKQAKIQNGKLKEV